MWHAQRKSARWCVLFCPLQYALILDRGHSHTDPTVNLALKVFRFLVSVIRALKEVLAGICESTTP